MASKLVYTSLGRKKGGLLKVLNWSEIEYHKLSTLVQ